MSSKYRWPAIVAGVIVLTAVMTPGHAQRSRVDVQRIILHSRHLGAHGLGYNNHSLVELSRALDSSDIPNMISLLPELELRVGAEFALASQCDAAILPVREAAIRDEKIAVLDADDIMELIAEFDRCTPETQARARAIRTEIDAAYKERLARRQRELEEKAANDARIQANGIKMVVPQQGKTLTRAEREEAFQRSIKAAGLENPQTPEQKALVERMYRRMVLGETSPPKSQ